MNPRLRLALVTCLTTSFAAAQQGFPDRNTPTVPRGWHAPATQPSGGIDTILPAAFATKMASTANRIPHARHNSRAQQVFLGSEIGGSRRWDQLCLRLDERFAASASTQSIEVRLGPSTKTNTNMSATFASNYSGPSVRVFNGTLNLPAHAGGGGVNSWGVCVKFTTAYVYTGGNLVVEMINRSATSVAHFDDYCLNDAGSTTARVFALDQNATAGTLGLAQGLIMRLSGTNPGRFTTFGTGCRGSGGASQTVLPAAFATKMASTANRIPHARHNSRAQQVFLGSEIGSNKMFTDLCLRLDERFAASASTQAVEVKLGPTAKSNTTLTSSFAGNYSGPAVTVFNGTLDLPAHAGGGGLNSWGVCVKFSSKYAYTGGNLIVEMINRSTTSVAHFDDYCLNDAGATTARVFALDKNATVGTVSSAQGLIMRLTGEGGAVPALSNAGVPTIGKSFSVNLSDARPNALALLFLGSRHATSGGSLAPGCTGYAWPDILVAGPTTRGGTASVAIGVPLAISLLNVKFAVQWAVNDPVNALMFVFSSGGEGVIGQ